MKSRTERPGSSGSPTPEVSPAQRENRKFALSGLVVPVLLLAAGLLLWWLTTEFVRALHAGTVPLLSSRLFRARDLVELAFYLELTRPWRLALSSFPIILALLALFGEGGGLVRPVRDQWRHLKGTVRRVNGWFPESATGQVLLGGISGALIALASGYQAVPGLSNDVVTYTAAARRQFDPTYLLGDLPIRGPDPALQAWGMLARGLAALFGIEGAFFAVSLLGGALLFVALQRLAGVILGANPRAAFVAGALGLIVTFGDFGYSLSVPSHAGFYPTPRFVAVAVAVLAVGFLFQGALVRGVALGLLATALNTLEGLVPVGLALLSVLLIRTVSARRPTQRTGFGSVLLWIAGLGTVTALIHIVATPILSSSPRAPGLFVLGGTFVSIAGLLHLLFDGVTVTVVERRSPLHVVLAGLLFVAGGFLLATQRAGGSTSGALESLALYEIVLRDVRQNTEMLVMSATQSSAALIFVVLVIASVGMALLAREPDRVPSLRSDRVGMLATWSALVLIFVTVGNLLLEFTALPGVVALWPLRPAWGAVLGAVVLTVVTLERHMERVGAISALVLAFAVLQAPILGRVAWSLAILVVGIAVALCGPQIAARAACGRVSTQLISSRQVVTGPPRDIERRWRRIGEVLPFIALPVLLLMVASVSPPEIRVADSMERLEREGSARTANIVQMARAAADQTAEDSRILIPPEFSWGAFRLLSGRGVAFEWKYFSTAQPGLWYEQMRRMCDPSYVIGPDEDFSVGLVEVRDCYNALQTVDLLHVARGFDATHAVIASGRAVDVEVLAATASGDYVLIRVP